MREDAGFGVYSHILREASASLLVQLQWAIPEPLIAGRATSTALTLFLYPITNADEGSPEAMSDTMDNIWIRTAKMRADKPP